MKNRHLFLPLFLVLFFACRKYPDTSKLSTNFVVQTSKEPGADFSKYKTYYISDTIASIGTIDSVWFDDDSKKLVEAVKSNMNARGFTLVANSHFNPDLGLGLTVIKDLNLGVVYPGWWWGGYWGCYWYYCGYPPYYGYGAVYSIPTGTIVLDMIDLKNATANKELDILWSSVMSGGLGNSSNDVQLGVNAINQSYEQSPYIQTH